MYHIKDDQRSIRSGRLIYEALAALIRERPFHDITVSELAARAEVGRATFYRNFDEIEDVLRMRCDQVFGELMAYVMGYRARTNESHLALLKPMLRYFNLNAEIVELLLLAGRMDILQGALRDGLRPFKGRLATRLGVSEAYTEYTIAIRIGVLTSILTQWVESGMQPPPDDLAEALGSMIEEMVTLDQLL